MASLPGGKITNSMIEEFLARRRVMNLSKENIFKIRISHLFIKRCSFLVAREETRQMTCSRKQPFSLRRIVGRVINHAQKERARSRLSFPISFIKTQLVTAKIHAIKVSKKEQEAENEDQNFSSPSLTRLPPHDVRAIPSCSCRVVRAEQG